MATPDVTRKETAHGSEATLIYGSSPVGVSGTPGTFRGMRVLEQLPTKGAEADIFIADASGERRVLKLYRHRMEPKIEVLNRVAAVSRANRHYFVEFFDTGFDEATGRWYELQEYMPLGSLRDMPPEVKRAPGFIAEFALEISGAIHCLHENEIIHCDIKPANILIRSLIPLDAVLTDFGISSLLAADMSQKMTSLKGTPMYWAPEAFSREIGRPCDWWGMGMILLELLAGEHPFEGMSDSQIIHRLTLGNVDIPAAIDPVWATLLKGLLTKDDARRWGKAEIDRWAAGDRSVPVFYSREGDGAGGQKPFQFEGAEYTDDASLARALGESEAAWLASLGYLNYLRRWFESNLRFDEAMKIGQAESSGDPELAFFRFVHRNARLPFLMMGRELDARSVAECLRNSAEGGAATGDSRIAKMVTGGRMLFYYDEYTAISGAEGDAGMRAALALSRGRDPEEAAEIFSALSDPGGFVWPGGAGTPDGGAAEAMSAMGRPPMRREFWSGVTENFTIPSGLVSMINSGDAAAYARAASTVESWSARGILMRDPPSQWDGGYASLSEDEYERTARSIVLGHTDAALSQARSLADRLERLYYSREMFAVPSVPDTVEKLRALPDKKMTPADTAFIAKMTKLMDGRDEIARSRWQKQAIYSVMAGLLTLLIHAAGGDHILRGSLIASAAAAAAMWFHNSRLAKDVESHDLLVSSIWVYCLALFIIGFALFGRIMAAEPIVPSFLAGALPAAILQFGADLAKFTRNGIKLLESCADYARRPAP